MAPETLSARRRSAAGGDLAASARSSKKGIFSKEGEYWTVGYNGSSFRLRDSKGLGYLAHLLRHPGTEFHVLDLVGGIAVQRDEDEASPSAQGLPRGDEGLEQAGIHIGNLGDAGEMLDEQAKIAYRRRLSELREALEEAKELGNIERAEQAEQEIEALTSELSRAVGLGGRNRRAASASERARQSVTKTIKAVLERIEQSDAALGDILSRSITTGTFCSYHPGAEVIIAWQFSAETIEPPPQPLSDTAPPIDRPRGAPPVLEVSPFSLAERTAFVGREAELTMIRGVIDRALSGQGSLVMLGGGPGVGKSRLAMEIAQYASRVGFRCLVGHCYERDEPFPYLPFAEIIESALAQTASLDDFRRWMADNAPELAQIAPSLRRVFPDLPQPVELPPAQKRRFLFQSVSDALGRAAQTRSQLQILEDLHWADESTLGLLSHLSNRVAQLPVVIIGTYRDVAIGNPAFSRTLEELIRMGVRPRKVGGLSRDAVRQMLHELSRREAPENLLNIIFEESQGYPFFIEEVYRHLVEEGKVFDDAGHFRKDIAIDEIDVPENVRLIISRRLERLDENDKRILAAAAVIGRSFSFRLLAEVAQIDVDDLFTVFEKAQQMGILVASSEGPENPLTFTHELVRQTLLAGISVPRKQQLHATVADTIERLYPRFVNERAGEIADHLLKAGSFADARRVFTYLVQAGKSALDAAAFEDARRSFQSALAHRGASDPKQRADLLASLAKAELGFERWDEALANLREALEIQTNLGDREMIGQRFVELTDALIWVGRFEEAAQTAERGLDHLGQDVSANRLHLLAAYGQASPASSAGHDAACTALNKALEIASKLNDPMLEARVLGARSIVNLHFFRMKESAADGLLSEQLAGAVASPWQRALQLRVLHQVLLTLGRLDEAIRIAEVLEPLAAKIGQAYAIALCLSTRTWLEFVKELSLPKLEAGFREVAKSDAKANFPFWSVLSEVQLSVLDLMRGDWTNALSHAEACAETRWEENSIRGLGEGVLFRQLAYCGDRERAFALLDQHRALLPVSGQENIRGAWWLLTLVVEGLFMLGERAQAGHLYPLVRELIETGAVVAWPSPRYTQTIAALAAAGARDWKASEEHFRIARRQADFFPDRLEQAEICRFYAMMLVDRGAPGDREKAQNLLREALVTYTNIGMPRHIEMIQGLAKSLQD